LYANRLNERIKIYAKMGKEMDPYNPQSIIEIATKTFKEL
jgi:hypothetical protein